MWRASIDIEAARHRTGLRFTQRRKKETEPPQQGGWVVPRHDRESGPRFNPFECAVCGRREFLLGGRHCLLALAFDTKLDCQYALL
jgi:hypothetical protein